MSDYICQRCRLPLVVDPSLQELSNAQKRLLTTGYSQRPAPLKDTLAHKTPPPKVVDKPKLILSEERKQLYDQADKSQPLIKQRLSSEDSSFVYLKEKEIPNGKTAVSEQVSTLHNVFNAISSKYEIDYPVCSDCATMLIDQMNVEFDQLSKEKDTYVQFLKKLTSQNGPNIQKSKDALAELDRLQKEEKQLLVELREAEQESNTLKDGLTTAEKELADLDAQEKELCVKQNEYELQLTGQLEELDRVRSLYETNNDQLDTLRRADVFNDTFNISSDDKFGTINGLRLGSLDETNVSWHEINAALGQVVLLLYTCVRILEFDLKDYVLVPMGSTSRIEKVERTDSGHYSRTPIELFSTGEFSIGRIFTRNKLDAGMVALLDVVRRIGAFLVRQDSNNELPFKMTKDKIAGYNIRPSARASNEEWTSACKYLLTNVKWILSYSETKYRRE